MIKQIHNLKGLNLRTPDFSKPENQATVIENFSLNSKGYLVNRDGIDEFTTGDTGAGEMVSYYNGTMDRQEILQLREDGLYRQYPAIAGSWELVGVGDPSPVLTYDSKNYNIIKYNKCVFLQPILYTNDTSGLNNIYLIKYDGAQLYRAGVPNDPMSGLGVGTGFHLIAFFQYQDFQTNILYGEYEIREYAAGNIVPFKGPTTNFFNYTQLPSIPEFTINNRWTIRVYISDNASFGFKELENITVTYPVDTYTNNKSYTIGQINTALDTGAPLSDIYDISVTGSTPPQGTSISVYNNVLVVGDAIPRVSSAGGGTIQPERRKGSIQWADTTGGVASSENFPTLNEQKVGETETLVTALFGDSDNLQIFKEDEVWSLSGELYNLNYRLRNNLSEGIGCTSQMSIQQVSSGCMFMSQKGVYFVKNGEKPIEFSDIIEPLFTETGTTYDLTKTISILDSKKEIIYIFIEGTDVADSIILLYDFYHTEWFIWKGINASGGFAMHENEIHFTDGVDTFKLTEGKTVDLVDTSIACRYRTAWISDGTPSLKKKYTKINLFSPFIANPYQMVVKTEENWKEGNYITNTAPFSLGGDYYSVDKSLAASSCLSARISFEVDTVVSTPVELVGYEVNVEKTQTTFKGVN